MRSPTIKATMQRRILVNYRVDAEALASILPSPFRPALVQGYGIAGICLIRLAATRPAGLPMALGTTSESAAHRVAVEWDTEEGLVCGVYVPRATPPPGSTCSSVDERFPVGTTRPASRSRRAPAPTGWRCRAGTERPGWRWRSTWPKGSRRARSSGP